MNTRTVAFYDVGNDRVGRRGKPIDSEASGSKVPQDESLYGGRKFKYQEPSIDF